MKCSDIPDIKIIQYLFYRKANGYDNSIDQAFPKDTPEKLVRAKMKKLIDRGLVDGCACGCRGDFEITKKGVIHFTELPSSHDLNSSEWLRNYLEGPTSVGQPALGLEPAPIVNDKTNL